MHGVPHRSIAQAAVTQGRPPVTRRDTDLARAARPLLQLIQRLTGMETSFITRIDWLDQMQEVVVALNTTLELVVAEGGWMRWRDSMCRRVFLNGSEQSTDVRGDFPDSVGARVVGMRSFFALPILSGDDTVLGTVCGASRQRTALDGETLERLHLVAAALANLMRQDVDLRGALARADDAELESRVAHTQAADVAQTVQRMETLALTDPLTGLPNRRAFAARWEEELARSGRHGHPIAVLLLDLDDFKLVNDSQGHVAGDRVLVALGRILHRVSRAGDFAARMGGDEFVLVAPHTDAAGAERLAERIRDELTRVAVDFPFPCTVSIGVSTSASTPREDLVETADAALYEAKRRRRNRILLRGALEASAQPAMVPTISAPRTARSRARLGVLVRPARVRPLTVPSGTFIRRAISLCVYPPK